MPYNNIVTYYPNNMYQNTMYRNLNNRPIGPGRPPINNINRPIGGEFLLPFALGFASSPLILGATRPRPPYYGPYPYYPYYPYY